MTNQPIKQISLPAMNLYHDRESNLIGHQNDFGFIYDLSDESFEAALYYFLGVI